MRKRLTRVERAADNDARLASAARTVFLRRGYHGATLDQVARAAGLTKGAVYARHASKAELFLSLLDTYVTTRIAEIATLPAPIGAQTVEDVVRQWLARTSDDNAWSLLILEFRVASTREPGLAARYRAIHERLISAVVTRLERVTPKRATPTPPREVVRLGLALASGVLIERATGSAVSDASVLRAHRALYTGLAAPPGSQG